VEVEDCTKQRNLSSSGREQARDIGAGFHRLLIPVGEVRSSPYCRAADTARLAFGRVFLDTQLAPLSDADASRRAAGIAALRHLLGTVPLPGTNTVLVGHAESMEALGEPKLHYGEAVVAKPLPEGGHQFIDRVPAEAWSTMPIPVQ
jgi:phosphohistidine phosphatase SixA